MQSQSTPFAILKAILLGALIAGLAACATPGGPTTASDEAADTNEAAATEQAAAEADDTHAPSPAAQQPDEMRESEERGATGLLAGTWEGAIAIAGQELAIVLHFPRSEGAPNASPEDRGATIDIPPQNAFDLPLTEVSVDGNNVRFVLPVNPQGVFEGTVEGNTIAGDYVQGTAQGTFRVERRGDGTAAGDDPGSQLGPAPAFGNEVSLPLPEEGEGARLVGSLHIPDGADSAVLIVPGSGPTDRDGNTPLIEGRNDSLLQLAQALGQSGIATLRIDKRGVGASVWRGLTEEALTIDAYVSDVRLWIEHLSDRPGIEDVALLGHSEGGLVSAVALSESADASGLVMLAAPGQSYQDTLRAQLSAQLPESLMDRAEEILSALEAGRRVSDVPQALQSLFRPSVQPFLISAFEYDPAEVLASLDLPILIVQGTADIQVDVGASRRLADANESAELEIADGMSHVLKQAPAGQEDPLASYRDPSFPLHPALVRSVREFVSGL